MIRDVVVNKFQQELQRTVTESNKKAQRTDERPSPDSNNDEEDEWQHKTVSITSPSKRSRRSLGSPAELALDQRERKQRRSLANDRNRQLWVSCNDKSIMTDPMGKLVAGKGAI